MRSLGLALPVYELGTIHFWRNAAPESASLSNAQDGQNRRPSMVMPDWCEGWNLAAKLLALNSNR